MIRLIQFLIHGCFHEWEVLDKSELEWSNDFGIYRTCMRFYVRCKKCGHVKNIDCK